jgi:hypothetical protein
MLLKTKTKISIIGLFGALMIGMPTVNAAYMDFGTLDVHPVTNSGAISKDWFIEYLKPGQKQQQLIEISNFSSSPKELKLYMADADVNEGSTFYAKSPDQTSEDLNSWINLPVDTITLKGGESKKLSVNFNIPKNAGVGLHTGAVMVREIVNPGVNSQSYAIEKGVRVYLNVTGAAVTKVDTTNIQSLNQAQQITTTLETKNLGTTDYKVKAQVRLEDVFGQTVNETSNEIKIRPGQEKQLNLSVEKPSFGFYNLILTNGNESSQVTSLVVVPAWSLFLTLGLILAFSLKQNKKPVRSVRTKTTAEIVFNTIKSGTQSLVLQKSAVYFMLLLSFTSTTLWIASLSPNKTQAQGINKVANSYLLTTKWGDLRHLHPNGTKEWKGELSFHNADVEIQNLLHFETNDSAQLTQNGTTVSFNLTTGPDNDGFVLNVKPTSEEIPTVTILNSVTSVSYTYNLADLVSSNYVLNQGVWGTYLNAELGAEHILNPADATRDMNATPEVEATPETYANIPELENLFTEDLPSTPEVLADFVLSSDYVQEINEDKKTTQVEADPILIEALEATPEVLQDIAASPDLNFIFITSETVNFPPEEFSFSEDKTTTQDIGTMIFVQNKEENWNTYIATSDFIALSGKGKIPASALTIDPGEPTILIQDGASVDGGSEQKFDNSSDKTTLVEVNPGNNENSRSVFVLNPSLKIRIPAGTLPGRYRGTLTITSL